ncbi:probable cadmium/zinc-transporting ATPase HMA1, chloroplastic [Rhododendron vialii]|uniref:probable cadmium/zinc-transporting ATPase HMA1, chloroplastic n=1 Tax=Rhododendron vialii TaxID=182163 RepID=UPI0026602AB2|nr:probable cadmium/zinc-transporting ATPase HMA1, chloroplastic [Rhododendron vialii]
METLRFHVGITPFPSHNLTRIPRITKPSNYSLKLNPFRTQALFLPPILSPPRSLSPPQRHSHSLPNATHPHHHDHHDHQHEDHNHHHHHHNRGCENTKLTRAQESFLRFAKAIRWTDLADFLREHLVLCCCSAALFVCAAACPYVLPKPAAKPLQHICILIAFPLVGVSASLDSLIDITGGKINIHVLMALAAFASAFMGNPLEGGLLLAMFNLAHIAEEYFTSRSKIDVKELKENHPDFALVLEVRNGKSPNFSDLSYTEVPVNNLEVGSYILVKAGESVPVDCEVFLGRSTITIEHLTGEVKPVERKVGDTIPGGARNLDGMMIVKAKNTWKESMLSRIVQLTEEAQLSKPKLQRWLDKFGDLYSKVVVVLSVGVALLGPLLFKWPLFSTAVCRGSVYRALGLMVAASPCALAVAPLAYATAISACARKGIFLKGGHVLDALASCHTIAFDKTGTLTTGEFMCKAIEPIHGHMENDRRKFAACCIPSCEKEALAVAAAMEKGTTHPIGRAVVDHSVGKDLPSFSVESFENLPGRGLFATLSSIEPGLGGGEPLKASLGSVEFITSLFNSEDESKKIVEAVISSSHGSDFVHAALAINNKKVTLFHLEDKLRPGAMDVILALQNQAKLQVIMLTGDHESSAWRVANAIGINEVYCNLKPEDKLSHVTSISKDTGGGLIMVGDGINDAPALAAATVGAVLAQRASATAIAVADVLLLQDNISGLPFCFAKSLQTTSLVKQNVALALSSIVLASLTSVLGFLPLWLTVLLHEGGTLLVCLNSIRALNNPTLSWTQNLLDMVAKLQSIIMVLRSHGTRPGTIQAAPL